MGESFFFLSFSFTSDDAINFDNVAIDDPRTWVEPVAKVLLVKARRQVEFVQILDRETNKEKNIHGTIRISEPWSSGDCDDASTNLGSISKQAK